MLSFLKRILKKLFGYHSKEDLAKEYAKEIIYEIYKNTELIPKLRNHYEFFYNFLLKVSSSKHSIKKARDLIKDIESLISFYFSKHIKILEPKNLITVLEAYIATAKNIEDLSFYKSLLNSDEVLSFPSPSLFFKFLFEFFIKNKEKLEFPDDLYKSLRVVKLLYQKTGIDQDIISQKLILILTNLKLNKVISDIEIAGIEILDDFSFFEEKMPNKETISILYKDILPEYINFLYSKLLNKENNFRDFFGSLLDTLIKRYTEDEALFQSVLSLIPYILKNSNQEEDILKYVLSTDKLILDFLELLKNENTAEKLKVDKKFIYPSLKLKKDIYTKENLLIHYILGLRALIENSLSAESFEKMVSLIEEISKEFEDVEITFYYAVGILPRWLKDFKITEIEKNHSKLKKFLYSLSSDRTNMIRTLYIEFKDSMLFLDKEFK